MLMAVGLKNVIMCDSKGPIWEGRPEGMNKYKDAIAKATNPDKVKGTLADAIKGVKKGDVHAKIRNKFI